MNDIEETFGEVISRYTRGEAIEDGILVDVSGTAKEAGIHFPTVLTRGVWDRCVRVPDGVRCQDEAGRLWDVLNMFRFAVRSLKPGVREDVIFFKLHVRNDNREGTPPLVTLRAVCGPGDNGEPVITILLVNED